MRGRVLGLVLAATSAGAAAAAPAVEFLSPAGGQQGSTISVTAGGKFDDWPVKAWADHPGIKAEAGKDKGAFTIRIEKEVPVGPHLIRFYDETGAATPVVFVVGRARELAEAEGNDEVAKAQAAVALPVVANGRLEKSGDVDCYSVDLAVGQTLVASLTSRRLGAPTDPMLHLTDDRGNPLHFVHDGHGLDPLLVWRAETAGRYVVRVSAFAHPPAAEVRLTGGPSAVYRLGLGTELPARYAMPAGVRRGTRSSVQVVRWDGSALDVDVDATDPTTTEPFLDVGLPVGDDILRLALSDGAELTESRLKRDGQAPPPIDVPAAVTGRIERDGEEDAYSFAAKKGQKFVIAARSVATASALDAVVRVENAEAKTLAADDDKGEGSDARVEWEAGADGTYRAVVGDLFGRGGEAHVYRLSVAPAGGGAVSGSLDADAYAVAPGKGVALKLTVTRGPVDAGGYAGGMVAAATGLPPGVVSSSAEVPSNGGDVVITVSAAADAKPHSGPVRVMLFGTDAKRPGAWVATAGVRKEKGQELVDRTDAPWLTVLAGPAPAPQK